ISDMKRAISLSLPLLLLALGCSDSGNSGPTPDPGTSSWDVPVSSDPVPDNSSCGTCGTPSEGGFSSGTETTSSSAGDVALADLLTEAQFNQIFPIMNPSDPCYNDLNTMCAASKCTGISTYQGFLEAAARFPAFLAVGSADDRKRELAGFLAHSFQETGGGGELTCGGVKAGALCKCEEDGYNDASVGGYAWSNDSNYQAVAGKSYHGRGPIQLSYPYNYGPASEYLYGDKTVWLNDPGQVLRSSLGFWGSAIWFWTVKEDHGDVNLPTTLNGDPDGAGLASFYYYKPSCHMAMTGTWKPRQGDVAKNRTFGFGVTINIVNGIECSGAWDYRGEKRVEMYKYIAGILGVSPVPSDWTGSEDDYLTCKNQTSFMTP
ncbi:MAG: hypothetical protein J6Z50_04690, partial [Fibrobacterales bacterium]|nr:hypothetical protein [Fibrobacterales bacterium]